MYESLTKFIPRLEKSNSEGKSLANSIDRFIGAVLRFHIDNPEFQLGNYNEILRSNQRKIFESDISELDGEIVVAMIFSVVRSARSDFGFLTDAIEKGKIKKWLLRLKEIDEQHHD